MNNKGYVNYERSVRSANAISNYEVPISMINKALINEFIEDCENYFNEKELYFLKNIKIAIWKYVATQRMSATSWHHTSSYFNKTNHYDLYAVATRVLEIEDLEKKFKEFKELKKKAPENYKYGVIKVQIWGGSRKRPKLEGHEEVAGIVVGDWLYYKNSHSIHGTIGKYKINANKVEWIKEYDSYAELVKENPAYKGTIKIFNCLIKEKNGRK